MKKRYGTIFLGLFFVCTDQASENCMDNSKHTDLSDGYDYKKYYYVGNCQCPCERYAHSYKRNRCQRCLHFNVDRSKMHHLLAEPEK